MFRKFFLSFFLILIFTFYSLSYHKRGRTKEVVIFPSENGRLVPGINPNDISPMGMNSIKRFKGDNVKHTFKDGEFIGSIVNAYYGKVQVKAVIQNGRLIDVKFLSYPKERNTSAAISGYAMPILKTEAIHAQNARIDIVSGATFTSQAFKKSLMNALSQSKKQL